MEALDVVVVVAVVVDASFHPTAPTSRDSFLRLI
jgi:hypothetical protein